MTKLKTIGPAPAYSDDVLKHAIVGIVKAYPHISPKSLSGELWNTATAGRLKKLIRQSVKWDGNQWTLRLRARLTPDGALLDIADSVMDDLKNGVKPMDIAVKRGIAYSAVLGVKRGRYDSLLAAARNSKRLVKVNGMLKLYDEKGYEPSGKSIKGAIELSDDYNQLRCHECGDWFENLGAHVRYEHGMKTRDYKMAHALNLGTALIGDSIRLKKIAAMQRVGSSPINKARAKRAAMIAAGTGGVGKRPKGSKSAGLANLRGNCAAQLTNDLRILADRVGHIPSESEVRRAGICFDAVAYRFGNVKKALKTVGVSLPTKSWQRWYTDEQLIGMLKAFRVKHKRQPFQSDLRRGLLPSSDTFRRRFGSFNKALVKAGMRANATGWAGTRFAKRAKSLEIKCG